MVLQILIGFYGKISTREDLSFQVKLLPYMYIMHNYLR